MLDVQETMNNEEMMEVAEAIGEGVSSNSSKLLGVGVGIVLGSIVGHIVCHYVTEPLGRKLSEKINERRRLKEESAVVDIVPEESDDKVAYSEFNG